MTTAVHFFFVDAFLSLLSFVCLLFFFLQVYYLRQGHELYVKEVMATKCYDINPKKQCYYKIRLKVCQHGFFFYDFYSLAIVIFPACFS